MPQKKPVSLGLSIRKDIFMSPKKEVIELGVRKRKLLEILKFVRDLTITQDSPPKSVIHESPQVNSSQDFGRNLLYFYNDYSHNNKMYSRSDMPPVAVQA